jgi:hypothetical protein
MSEIGSRRRGRPVLVANPGERVSLGLKVTPEIKNRLDTAATITGRSQSQEAETRLAGTFEHENTLSEIMGLAFGEANGGLMLLSGEALRVFVPHGEWVDEPATYETVARVFVRLLQRVVRSPSDGHIARDGSLEARVDSLLYELGDDGSAHPGPLLAIQRWAADRRKWFGPTLAARLIEMHKAVKDALPAKREAAEPDPESTASSWERAFTKASAPPSPPLDYVEPEPKG